MDIARYIGLFLLKNKYCYIHGLGNLELKKKSAHHDGQSLNSPAYEVVITHGGSIDDTLANFIATNEQISISKASNTLRDFSTQAKNELAAGNDVVIPSLGKFTRQGGAIQFITDDKMLYTPPSMPVVRSAPKAAEPAPKQQPAKPKETAQPAQKQETYTRYIEPEAPPTNWKKIIGISVLAIIVIGCIALVINYFNNAKPQKPVEETVAAPVEEPVVVAAPDTVAKPPADSMQMNGGLLSFRILLKEYETEAKAKRRVEQLKGFGYDVEMATKDSGKYFVLLRSQAIPQDTTRVLDSVARLLNPSGVTIYR